MNFKLLFGFSVSLVTSVVFAQEVSQSPFYALDEADYPPARSAKKSVVDAQADVEVAQQRLAAANAVLAKERKLNYEKAVAEAQVIEGNEKRILDALVARAGRDAAVFTRVSARALRESPGWIEVKLISNRNLDPSITLVLNAQKLPQGAVEPISTVGAQEFKEYQKRKNLRARLANATNAGLLNSDMGIESYGAGFVVGLPRFSTVWVQLPSFETAKSHGGVQHMFLRTYVAVDVSDKVATLDPQSDSVAVNLRGHATLWQMSGLDDAEVQMVMAKIGNVKFSRVTPGLPAGSGEKPKEAMKLDIEFFNGNLVLVKELTKGLAAYVGIGFALGIQSIYDGLDVPSQPSRQYVGAMEFPFRLGFLIADRVSITGFAKGQGTSGVSPTAFFGGDLVIQVTDNATVRLGVISRFDPSDVSKADPLAQGKNVPRDYFIVVPHGTSGYGGLDVRF